MITQRQASALRAIVRDRREPGRREKLRVQLRMAAVIRKLFLAQRERIAAWAQTLKALPDIPPGLLDADDAELVLALIEGLTGGIALTAQQVRLDADWTRANTRASRWARQYVGQLIREINSTTLDAVRQAVALYVETPGMEIGDLMRLLPFDAERALRIAVTETTRAFAQGQAAARDELREQFPDVVVETVWHTNNDDIVCDVCGPLDGRAVDDDTIPPAHPNCRCWISVNTRIERGRS